jgi:hypothetical protein
MNEIILMSDARVAAVPVEEWVLTTGAPAALYGPAELDAGPS